MATSTATGATTATTTSTNPFSACANSCNLVHVSVKIGLAVGAMALLGLENMVFTKAFPKLYEKSDLIPFVPKGFGLVLISNLLLSVSTLIFLARRVVAARHEFKEKAKKEGGDVSELEFEYPKLYAEGNSELARKFNAIQRGHQQALESYAPYVQMSLIAGTAYPVVVALGGLAWCVSRVVYADIYARELTPMKCKTNPFSYGVPISHMVGYVGTLSVALRVIGISSIHACIHSAFNTFTNTAK